MRNFLKILTVIFLLASCVQNDNKQKESELKERELAFKEKELLLQEKSFTKTDTLKSKVATTATEKQSSIRAEKPKNKEEQWKEFFAKFKIAFNTKNKSAIYPLISKEFFAGGDNATGKQWIDRVFSEQTKSDFRDFQDLKEKLNRGVKNFNQSNFKATGESDYGDLFFDYKGGEWTFGGLIGD